MPNPEGRYVGTFRFRDSIANYRPAPLTEAERRFRTQPVRGSGDLSETPTIFTPVELTKIGLKAITGPGRYGRSDEARRAGDEALEHESDCGCSDCKAANAAFAGTKDSHMRGLHKINQANRKAHGQR